MLYSESSSSIQRYFRSDLFKILHTYLEKVQYTIVDKNTLFVTDNFIQIFIGYLQETVLFSKWEKLDFKISRAELKILLQEIEKCMRKRNSTLKNKNYFYSLLRDLRLQEEIPQDFLCMKKRLLELELMKKQGVIRGHS
ncbi:hypothetical protein [Bacillus mycoides]|uniref:hypothetical protein n=1 Tax=Bacillus mycoides TaxID=1405 RepID=UPI003D25BEF5